MNWQTRVMFASLTGGRRPRRAALPVALGLLLSCLLLLAGCASRSGTTWARVRETGVLRVGLDPTYPPFENAEDGTLRGFDVDLARALAADQGLEANFAYIAYDGLYDALATERVDVLISALVIRPDQMADFAYSDPYFNAGQILLVPGVEAAIDGMEDLSGGEVAVELGSQGHYEATRWQQRIPNLEIAPFPTAGEALASVAPGGPSAALVDSISGLLYLRDHYGLRVAGDPVTVEPFALVMRKEDSALRTALNESLERLRESGRLAEIRSRWLYE